MMPSQPPIFTQVRAPVPVVGRPESHPIDNARNVRNRKKKTPIRARLLLKVPKNINPVKMVHPSRKIPPPAEISADDVAPVRTTRLLPPNIGARVTATASQNPP